MRNQQHCEQRAADPKEIPRQGHSQLRRPLPFASFRASVTLCCRIEAYSRDAVATWQFETLVLRRDSPPLATRSPHEADTGKDA
jgi:hypothetical protein